MPRRAEVVHEPILARDVREDKPNAAQCAQAILTICAELRTIPPMFSADRRVQLLARLREDGQASVEILARDLGVTPSTISRDIMRLANDGALVRTYGGSWTE